MKSRKRNRLIQFLRARSILKGGGGGWLCMTNLKPSSDRSRRKANNHFFLECLEQTGIRRIASETHGSLLEKYYLSTTGSIPAAELLLGGGSMCCALRFGGGNGRRAAAATGVLKLFLEIMRGRFFCFEMYARMLWWSH